MKKVAALLALVLASTALVACGGGDDDSGTTATTGAETTSEAAGGAGAKEEGGGGTASTLEFEADPGGQLAFTTTEATAKAGKVTIEFNNPQPLPHDVKVEANGQDAGGTDTVSEGSASATVNLKPGTYTFYCSVPGHREAGMEGTLTVK
jgi:plastocyanin